MKKPQITDFINGPVTYDEYTGGYFWVNGPDGIQMLLEMRGWGHIQNMFVEKNKGEHGKFDLESAAKFQDEVGRFIAEAINEKVEKLKTV